MDNIEEIESKRLDWLRNEEPYCWESFNVVSQKPFCGKLPVQSLQPGVYQHTKLFSEKQVIGLMKAAYYDGYTDSQKETKPNET